jgi:sulfate adenylyltransferase subunit 1 (EFTu-like GTPase family)
VTQINELSKKLGFVDPLVIPVSALRGDNVVEPSAEANWYSGPTVLEALESAHAGSWSSSNSGARLPIQWVLRQHGGGRTYAGMVNGASFKVGDTVTLLPQEITTTIRAINGLHGAHDDALPGLSVDFDLADDTDAGRGDILATAPLPVVTREIAATVCWFGEKPMTPGMRLRVKHTTRTTPARIKQIDGALDIEQLTVIPVSELKLNEIGLIHIDTAEPLVVDDYRDDRVTGSFVLIDEVNNATVAAGMIGHVSFL